MNMAAAEEPRGRGYMLPSQTDVWATPAGLFTRIEKEFGPFDLDPAADATNAKAPRFITEEENAILTPWEEWGCGRIYINPPYSNIAPWVEKAVKAAKAGGLVVMLLPANRSEQPWFHRHVWDEATNDWRPGVEVRFIRGRVKFGDGESPAAPFPSMLVIFRPRGGD